MDKAIKEVRMKKWAGIIQAAAASGMTKDEFIEQNGICRRSFFYWQKQIREYVLQRNPDLVLPSSTTQVRQIEEANPRPAPALPVFCELKPQENEPVTQSVPVTSFTAGAMIQFGQYQIYIGDSVSEKLLATIMAVIQHA